MFSLKEGRELIKIARRELECYFKNQEIEKWDISGFKEKVGIFVSLYSYPSKKLRGCIGFPTPQMPLWESVREAARAAAFEDPRFLPLTKEELDNITIEISILTKPKMIETSENHKDRTKRHEQLLHEIEIGKDGLILEYSGYSALFLPQVPVEQKWDVEHFLQELCKKAGVSPQTWKNPSCKIYKFQAQIFSEIKPNGEIKEIKLI
ncbi:MAG: TIGR00296 family protein [Candidatus Pacearchaeota archaeon]